ncbi:MULTISPECIES: WxcM-like domain-containing protein [Prochlorococcus]|uniref:WxcM-like domain-containing protein n=1 Tax=Prochlorococcus TaxID=1218 RepID=UPI00053392FD|nr:MULTISPECIES: WxcM-like domain-containing protein [Prochlorococcus]KGG12039.1 dTDP-4-dehydrorhamnose 3,5-epimerase [Prochlorococcus sp. MIT 0601]
MDLEKQNVSRVQLRRIAVEGGDVLHILKSTDKQYKGFKEAYFSVIEQGRTKAWKRHLNMTMNIVAPVGSVQFILYDKDLKLILNTVIGEKEYYLLTVPPGIWFGFRGLSKKDSYILNIANVLHDPNEVERQPLSFLNFLEVEK